MFLSVSLYLPNLPFIVSLIIDQDFYFRGKPVLSLQFLEDTVLVQGVSLAEYLVKGLSYGLNLLLRETRPLKAHYVYLAHA